MMVGRTPQLCGNALLHVRPAAKGCNPDAILEFLFGSDANVAQDGAGEFGKEALDQVEPGAMGGGEGKFEAVRGRAQ
jgi:hypothetical protein